MRTMTGLPLLMLLLVMAIWSSSPRCCEAFIAAKGIGVAKPRVTSRSVGPRTRHLRPPPQLPPTAVQTKREDENGGAVDASSPSTTTLQRIADLALPALVTLALDPLLSLVDTAIVGRVDSTALAGLGLNTFIFSFTSHF